ncbi:MAG TPA: dynamin family protein [Vicinamibacterales bacterium]|nr:dynamin family protein [Vicinamibacterales bacterium]HPW21776.1 dynamin family protein [Vicinamibacterales bacterium]
MPLSAVLDDVQRRVLAAERELLGNIRTALARAGADDGSLADLAASIAQLDELFLLVVVGEFNSGKSVFINALLGRAVLPEGVTPTTAEITLLAHGDPGAGQLMPDRVRLVTAPVDLLRDLHIVDTPGTNAVIREHEALTTRFVPRADLVLFVTSIDRPFSESERAFLERIRAWGKHVVFVVNKHDLVTRAEEVEEVRRFVLANATKVLGAEPTLFFVSARDALRAKTGQPALWASSGFEALEGFITGTLDDAGRLRLKLLNPLGVARHVVDARRALVTGRLDLLSGDVATLDEVDRQLAQYERDLARGFEPRMAAIDNVLLEMERRGQAYFDEMMRLGHITDLVNKSRVRESFERDVVADAPERIERRVDELIDWLVEADLRQWQAVTARLSAQRSAYRDRVLGGEIDHFRSDRARLIQSVGAEAQRVVDTYDTREESRALAESARNAVAAAAATGVGAVGLGAIVTIAASTVAADVTGIVMAGVLGAIGFLIIPAKRRRAKLEMREKVGALRARLSAAMRAEFESEARRGVQRIRDGIAPYARFVRAEGEKLESERADLARFSGEIDALRSRIDALGRAAD